ncbi:MAG: hemerythrin domain-containing protein [Deltaproteobacteria bacterium]|nr:hemerythrin domain-containing protein [Deltaproteobacteria bacterium]
MRLQLVSKPPALEEDLREFLIACHGRIRSSLSSAAAAAKAAGGSVEADRLHVDAAREAGRFFRLALPLHAEDEDVSIAPRLRALGDAAVDDALDGMTRDHAPIEELAQIVAGRCEAMAATAQAPAELSSEVARLAALLEPHLDFEERVVFPVLGKLDDAVRRQIASEARERRRLAYGGTYGAKERS